MQTSDQSTKQPSPPQLATGGGWMGRLVRLLVQLLGGSYEWETQTNEPDGCWRTWTSGFGSLEDAMESIVKDRSTGKRWNRYMPDEAVMWRVERRIVWIRYYLPNVKVHTPLPARASDETEVKS